MRFYRFVASLGGKAGLAGLGFGFGGVLGLTFSYVASGIGVGGALEVRMLCGFEVWCFGTDGAVLVGFRAPLVTWFKFDMSFVVLCKCGVEISAEKKN